jgi:hypothetical protein
MRGAPGRAHPSAWRWLHVLAGERVPALPLAADLLVKVGLAGLDLEAGLRELAGQVGGSPRGRSKTSGSEIAWKVAMISVPSSSTVAKPLRRRVGVGEVAVGAGVEEQVVDRAGEVGGAGRDAEDRGRRRPATPAGCGRCPSSWLLPTSSVMCLLGVVVGAGDAGVERVDVTGERDDVVELGELRSRISLRRSRMPSHWSTFM